ncbi:hypothetical protein [Bacteriovorax sp. DB6_IX]|uniref:hypothetical protein n=1 Tax=Bacteriovorax sp. DB6_IX TaxID=1353530 RepID=UPI000389EFED|nr:hypothetical protein [Bacteriovorax sp. DB6_IX]EQC49666.1 hypothetical protein M901_0324 [Bacteriovorax sp. DB6_IX]
MSNNTNTQTNTQTTTISENVAPIKGGQPQFKTWWIIVGLIFALFLLKSFIYIKDKKRHGK